MKKYHLFELCYDPAMPLLYNINSSFFGKYTEYSWSLNNPLTTESSKTLCAIFDLSVKKIISNVLHDIEPLAHGLAQDIHVKTLYKKLKYGATTAAMTMHAKIKQLQVNGYEAIISRTPHSMWFNFTGINELKQVGIDNNDLKILKDDTTKLELLLNNDNFIQFKWIRDSDLLFLQIFKYQTILTNLQQSNEPA